MLESQKGILKEFVVNRMCMSFGCLGDFVCEVGCLWGQGVVDFGCLFLCEKECFKKLFIFKGQEKQR